MVSSTNNFPAHAENILVTRTHTKLSPCYMQLDDMRNLTGKFCEYPGVKLISTRKCYYSWQPSSSEEAGLINSSALTFLSVFLKGSPYSPQNFKATQVVLLRN